MQDLETKLDELLVAKAPYQIPKQGREGIVKAMPWVTLLGGVLMIAAAWTLWTLFSGAMGVLSVVSLGMVAPVFSPLVWVGLAMLVTEAVMFFVAYPGLMAHKKSAWNLLYYVSLLNAAQAIVQFIGYTNLGTLLGSLLGTVVGLYILFQIRGYYTVDAPPAHGGQTPEPSKK